MIDIKKITLTADCYGPRASTAKVLTKGERQSL